MDILSVPPSVRHFYALKLGGLHQRTLEQEVTSIEPVHIAHVLSELE
jgi:hypothetical protein